MIIRQPKFRNALGVAVWVIKQPFKYDLKLSLTQILLTVASIIVEGSAIAALMVYTSSLDSDTSAATLDFLGFSLSISLPVLILTILTLLFIGGFFGLVSQVALSNLASRLEARITMDVLTSPARFKAGALPFYNSPRQTYRILKSIALKRAKFTGRTLRILMQSITDSFRAVIFLFICLYLAPGITSILCATTAIFLIFQLFLSQNIHSNQIEREKIAPKVNAEMDGFLASAYETAGSTNEIALGLASKYQSSLLKLSRSLYYKHLNATKYSEFIGSLNLATGIAIGAYLVAEKFTQSTMPLTEVIAYVIAVRLLLTSVKSLFSKLGAFSKLFIHANSVFQFIYAKETNTSRVGLKTTDGIHPSPQAIISNAPLSRITAAHFLKQFFPSDQVHEHYAILPGHLTEEPTPPFETLTGYSSIADVKYASESSPAIRSVWSVWQAYCDENSLDSLQQESWLTLVSKHPEIVHLFAGIGFEHRKIQFLVVAARLLRQTPKLLEIISELNPSIRIYIYISERQIPYKAANMELAYIIGKNGTVTTENFDWVNKNIHLFSQTLSLDNEAEGYSATQDDLIDSEDDDI